MEQSNTCIFRVKQDRKSGTMPDHEAVQKSGTMPDPEAVQKSGTMPDPEAVQEEWDNA